MTLQEAYVCGLRDGIAAYAWWKDGTAYVGTTGRTLREALENANNGTYPPQPNMNDLADELRIADAFTPPDPFSRKA